MLEITRGEPKEEDEADREGEDNRGWNDRKEALLMAGELLVLVLVEVSVVVMELLFSRAAESMEMRRVLGTGEVEGEAVVNGVGVDAAAAVGVGVVAGAVAAVVVAAVVAVEEVGRTASEGEGTREGGEAVGSNQAGAWPTWVLARRLAMASFNNVCHWLATSWVGNIKFSTRVVDRPNASRSVRSRRSFPGTSSAMVSSGIEVFGAELTESRSAVQ